MWCCDKRFEIYDRFVEDYKTPFLFDVDKDQYFESLVDKSKVCSSCKFWMKTRFYVVQKHIERWSK